MYICIVIHGLCFSLQGKCEVLTGWVLLNIQCGNGNNLSVKVFCFFYTVRVKVFHFE